MILISIKNFKSVNYTNTNYTPAAAVATTSAATATSTTATATAATTNSATAATTTTTTTAAILLLLLLLLRIDAHTLCVLVVAISIDLGPSEGASMGHLGAAPGGGDRVRLAEGKTRHLGQG
jgi:hypothetical protein